jgi:hypothetical protein
MATNDLYLPCGIDKAKLLEASGCLATICRQ